MRAPASNAHETGLDGHVSIPTVSRRLSSEVDGDLRAPSAVLASRTRAPTSATAYSIACVAFPVFALLVTLALFATPTPAHAQEVIRLTWTTRNAAPPASATPEVAPYLPFMRAGVSRLPESAIVNMALMQSGSLGLSAADSKKLSELVSRRYAAVAASPVFKDIPSTLGYCLSDARPTQGLALLYRPATTTTQTPVIVFIHGYGGSFLWYQHQLAEWFPNHIILCPSYGIDPSDIPAAYINESISAAAKQLKHALAKPALVGLSAGGFGTSRIYAANPSPYQQLIVLAAYPPDESFKTWPKKGNAGFIVGAQEYYVKDGGFATYAKALAARSTRFESVIIPKADHFFLLTNPAETRNALREWLTPKS